MSRQTKASGDLWLKSADDKAEWQAKAEQTLMTGVMSPPSGMVTATATLMCSLYVMPLASGVHATAAGEKQVNSLFTIATSSKNICHSLTSETLCHTLY